MAAVTLLALPACAGSQTGPVGELGPQLYGYQDCFFFIFSVSSWGLVLACQFGLAWILSFKIGFVYLATLCSSHKLFCISFAVDSCDQHCCIFSGCILAQMSWFYIGCFTLATLSYNSVGIPWFCIDSLDLLILSALRGLWLGVALLGCSLPWRKHGILPVGN